jgi:hypothetical protein
MTYLRWSLPDGEEEMGEPFPIWFVRAECMRVGYPKLRGDGFVQREDGIDLSALERAIDLTYLFGDALGSLCPDLAVRVLAADPSSQVALDASAGRMRLSDREIADLHAAPSNYATEALRAKPDADWLPWWWLGAQGTSPPHTGRARMHVLLRRFFAVHVLYGLANPADFISRAEHGPTLVAGEGRIAVASWDSEGLTAWVEETLEAFQRIVGPLPAVVGLD